MTQAAINLGLSQADRDNIDQACRAVEINGAGYFVIRDNDGRVLARFDSAGDLLLTQGEVFSETTITPDINTPEFIIKTGTSDYLAMIEPITEFTNGDLYLSGKVYENRGLVLYFPPNSFQIKDSSGEIMAFINSSDYWDLLVEWSSPHIVPAGSLILNGKVVTPELPN